MSGKREITHRFVNVYGMIDLDDLEIVCVCMKKHATVELCIKSNMNIPIAAIKLYNSNLWLDAEASFESASLLGKEIEKRLEQFISFQAENKELRDKVAEWKAIVGDVQMSRKSKNIGPTGGGSLSIYYPTEAVAEALAGLGPNSIALKEKE